ncbi:MAG: septum formation initiator family protein [Bacteroidales bacterium]
MEKKFTPEKKRIKRNRYYYTLIIGLIWMAFFDKNSLITRMQLNSEYKKSLKKKEFYQNEIKKMSSEIRKLETDIPSLEKVARERYLMKKDNEDIFLIIRNKE